jgi:hypothetical protein
MLSTQQTSVGTGLGVVGLVLGAMVCSTVLLPHLVTSGKSSKEMHIAGSFVFQRKVRPQIRYACSGRWGKPSGNSYPNLVCGSRELLDVSGRLGF